MPDITHLLDAAAAGDGRAAADLLPLVYGELRQLAAARMAAESPGHTLQPTALVHEAYLRLVGPAGVYQWDHRGHFFAAAAEAMRRILVDRARARQAAKRGSDGVRVAIELDTLAGRYSDCDLIDTDSALDALAAEDRDAAALVRLHVFAGLSIEEAGIAVGLGRSTAYRTWDFARAWLRDALTRSG